LNQCLSSQGALTIRDGYMRKTIELLITFSAALFFSSSLFATSLDSKSFPYSGYLIAEVAYSNGAVFFIEEDRSLNIVVLYRYTLASGRSERLKEIPAQFSSPPVIRNNSFVYFSTFENGNIYLHSVDLKGVSSWRSNAVCCGRKLFKPLVIGSEIFLQTNNGNIIVFSANGNRLYENHIPDRLILEPILIDNTTVLIGGEGAFYRLNLGDLISSEAASGFPRPGIIQEDGPPPTGILQEDGPPPLPNPVLE